MGDPFVAEIRMVPFNFPPHGWAQCDGQLMPISQNTALFSLLGSYYGGDGHYTFALPDFQGRSPMMYGQGPGLSDRFLGEAGGSSTVTLLESEIPSHNHQLYASVPGDKISPANSAWGTPSGRTPPPLYSSANSNAYMSYQALNTAGGDLPHNNMQPYLAVNFIIAMQGIFPPRG